VFTTIYLDLFNLSGVFTPSASFTDSGAVGTTGERIPSFRVVKPRAIQSHGSEDFMTVSYVKESV